MAAQHPAHSGHSQLPSPWGATHRALLGTPPARPTPSLQAGPGWVPSGKTCLSAGLGGRLVTLPMQFEGAVSSWLCPAEVTQPVVADGRLSATPLPSRALDPHSHRPASARPTPLRASILSPAHPMASAGPSSPRSQGTPQATWWPTPLPSSCVSSSGDSPRNCPQGFSSPHTSTPWAWPAGRSPVSPPGAPPAAWPRL